MTFCGPDGIKCLCVIYYIVLGILGDENNTSNRSGIQLWRAQGDLDEDVLDEFYERARYTEEIWKRDNRTVDFLIFEEEAPNVTNFLDSHNVSHKVLIDDVHRRMDDALLETFPTRRAAAVTGNTFTWKAYPTLDEINKYLLKLAAAHREYCKLTTIGNTLHRKPIYMLRISTDKPGNIPLLIDAGIHGREWTGVLSAIYFIDSIVKNFTKQPPHIQKKDWHIIPVLNPDGYEYSLAQDRMWRKNRRRLSGGCYGVDLNRNFAYNWGKKPSTLMVCGNDYGGPDPFSEQETKAFKNLVDGTHFKGYITIHSAGTKVLFPWSHLGPQESEYHAHLQMTKEMALAMRKIANYHFVNGDIQKLGQHQSFGMAIDWMYYVKQLKHAYMIETRGQIGLDLTPANQILPAVQEVRAGLTRFAELLIESLHG